MSYIGYMYAVIVHMYVPYHTHTHVHTHTTTEFLSYTTCSLTVSCFTAEAPSLYAQVVRTTVYRIPTTVGQI